MAPPRRTGRKESEVTRQAYYIGLATGEFSALTFVDVTDRIGKPMPFGQPNSALAMALSRRAAMFSLLRINSRSRPRWREQDLEFPAGPLARLDRKKPEMRSLGKDGLRLDLRLVFDDTPEEDAGRPVGDLSDVLGEADPKPAYRTRTDSLSYDLQIERQPGGGCSIGGTAASEEYELPKAAVMASVYFNGLGGTLPVGVGFIGHLDKPGRTYTAGRAAAVILRYMLYLPEFKTLMGASSVDLPHSSHGPDSTEHSLADITDSIMFRIVESQHKGAPVLEECLMDVTVSMSDVDTDSDSGYSLSVSSAPADGYVAGTDTLRLLDRIGKKVADVISKAADSQIGEGKGGDLARDIWLRDLSPSDYDYLKGVLSSVSEVVALPDGRMRAARRRQ